MTLTVAATLTALTLTAAGLYASICWLNPFTRCRRCDGTGYRTTTIRRRRACRRCRGTGHRLHTGRALANYARTVHRDATTTQLDRPGTRVPHPRQADHHHAEHDDF